MPRCVFEAEFRFCQDLRLVLNQMKSGVGGNRPIVRDDLRGPHQGWETREYVSPPPCSPVHKAQTPFHLSCPPCYMFTSAPWRFFFFEQRNVWSKCLSTQPGDLCFLEECLVPALSRSWYLLSLCVGGMSSVKEWVQVFFHIDIRHQLIRHFLSTIAWIWHTKICRKPRMVQNFLWGQPLGGLPPQDAADEALGLGWQSLWNVELATSDLAEEGTGLNVMERVPPYQHGVQHHSQAPHVGCFARVAATGVQDLWTHISWAAMLVRKGIIISPQDICIFKALQLDPSPARQERKHELSRALRPHHSPHSTEHLQYFQQIFIHAFIHSFTQVSLSTF